MELGRYKQAWRAIERLCAEFKYPPEPETLLARFERKYIAAGSLYSGCMHDNELAGHEQELKALLRAGTVVLRKSAIPTYELAAVERKRLIDSFDLRTMWTEQAQPFEVSGARDEIADVEHELGTVAS